MSMSQEEIESLMNGLDFEADEESSKPEVESNEVQGNMSEDDINELIAQTEDMSSSEATETQNDSETVDNILNSLENVEDSTAEASASETDIDDILKELEETNAVDQAPASEEVIEEPTIEEKIAVENEKVSEENIDELLSSIDGVTENTPLETVEPETVTEFSEPEVISEKVAVETPSKNDSESVDIDYKIDSGVFPLPVEEDTKVVNQLSEVANDSEEKATKIFDVLSNILDYNNIIQNDVQALSSFNEKQIAMLTSLSQKFPNINAFKENLTQAQEMGTYIANATEKLNDGNMEIFQAMELMQYHDINRQKIERVMSVIRKLSTYLNNLFEDEGNRAEVSVANHIHGDNTDDLVGDEDLEALIAEFNN